MTEIALASYHQGHRIAPALVHQDRVYDLGQLAGAGLPGPERHWLAGGIAAMIGEWDLASRWLHEVAARAAEASRNHTIEAIADGATRLAAPFRPERIFCAASNFIEHANEMGSVLAAKADSKPYMFLKLRNTVIGPGEPVRMPPETSQLDWEIELAVIIGKAGRRIREAQALDHVAGYAVINDISARDLNVRDDYPFKFDWFQGKCHDTFAPFGPCIVPSWIIPDPQAVEISLTVNGKEMQRDSTRNMIWSVREQIAYLSTIVTLEPGDVIATGTPTGVGMGRGIYLQAGDVVSASIDGIGTVTNTVIAEAT